MYGDFSFRCHTRHHVAMHGTVATTQCVLVCMWCIVSMYIGWYEFSYSVPGRVVWVCLYCVHGDDIIGALLLFTV